MQVTTTQTITISAKNIVDALDVGDFCELLCAAADKFDLEFRNRAEIANTLSGHLSENSIRLLAEVVTSHYARQPKS